MIRRVLSAVIYTQATISVVWLLRLVWQKEVVGLVLMLVGAARVATALWLAG